MKHTLLIYKATRIENALLRYFEGDEVKVFCKREEVTYTPSTEVNEEYIRAGMKRSREAFEKGEEDYWIAAVGYMTNLFKENKSTIIVV